MARRLNAIIVLACAGLLAACAERRGPPAPVVMPTPYPYPYGSVQNQAVFTQDGLASWYGKSHHGRTTASGEVFNMDGLTAAHRTLPFGTVVRVTDVATQRMVRVRINDRGPFVAGRIIDLSARAANDLGITRAGVARVKVEQLAVDQTAGR